MEQLVTKKCVNFCVPFLVLFFFCGLSVQAEKGVIGRQDTVIFDIDGGSVAQPGNWNPYAPGARLDHGFRQSLMEPLFILNYVTGDMIPWLAKSYTSNKKADIWTIRLREGITWSDGEALNADDIVYTINLLKSTPELENTANIIRSVRKIEKIDDLTVQFDLKFPNPRFLLDHFAVKIGGLYNILPEHIWKDQDPLTFTNYDPDKGWPVFSGPYTLFHISRSKFVYRRNDNWWGAKAGFRPLPIPKQLVWIAFGSEETRTAAMINNDLDSLMDISIKAFLGLKKRNPNIIAHHKDLPYSWPDPCVRTLEFNHTAEPWQDKDMRWAINFAINRDEVVSLAYEGTTTPASHFFPAYPVLNRYLKKAEEAGLYKKYPLMVHNEHKAREIIVSKGYIRNETTGFFEKDGKELSLHIQTPEAYIEKQLIARVITEQLGRIGINATWGNVKLEPYFDNFSLGNFEARIAWQACGSVNEPWASMNTFNISWYKPVGESVGVSRIGGRNGWRWQNKEYSDLVDEIGKFPLNDPAIEGYFLKAMDIWLEELPIIPITQARKIIPFNTSYWTNWPTAENSYLHPPTWWQSNQLILHNLQSAHSDSKIAKSFVSQKIRIVTTEAPPFSFREKGSLKGISTDVIRAILDKMDVKIEFQVFPWSRAYDNALNRPNTLIYLIERLPEREAKFKWVGTITPMKTHLYKLKKRTDIQIKKFTDVSPYLIGVRLQDAGHQYLKMRRIQKILPVNKLKQNIQLLMKGHIDLVLARESSFISVATSLGLNLEDFEKAYQVEELSVDGYMAFSKDTADEIVFQFRKALVRTKTSGEYEAIFERYGY